MFSVGCGNQNVSYVGIPGLRRTSAWSPASLTPAGEPSTVRPHSWLVSPFKRRQYSGRSKAVRAPRLCGPETPALSLRII
jgi:hypothetical protein